MFRTKPNLSSVNLNKIKQLIPKHWLLYAARKAVLLVLFYIDSLMMNLI